MRLLSNFLLVSIAGLTAMVAVFAGIGVTTIDDVLYQNGLHVLRAEIGSVARTLETKPNRAPISDKVLSETLRDQMRGTGDSHFAYSLSGEQLFPPANDRLIPFDKSTITRLVDQRGGEGWIVVEHERFLSHFVFLPGSWNSYHAPFPRSDEEQAVREIIKTERAPEGAGERILIAEDDNDVREMAIGMFESLNYTTLIASSAEEALEILEREDDIELLFTDVMLGSGDTAPELAKKAWQNLPGLRILFASGYAASEFDHGTPFELGALINKPYERSELAQAIRVALETARA